MSPLHYFDLRPPVYMHCDARLHGTGEALLQPDTVGNLILKGQQIVITQTLQEDILREIHIAHLGQEKIKLLTKDTVNINRYI